MDPDPEVQDPDACRARRMSSAIEGFGSAAQESDRSGVVQTWAIPGIGCWLSTVPIRSLISRFNCGLLVTGCSSESCGCIACGRETEGIQQKAVEVVSKYLWVHFYPVR